MELMLRDIRLEDLEKVHKIESNIYQNPWSLDFFKLMFYSNPDLFLLAIFKDNLVGYIVGNIESQKHNLKTKKLGHIMNIAVIPRFRKQGIGSLLIKALEKRLLKKGVYLTYLEVRESNLIAQKFYSNRGYVKSNIIHRYYGDENAILMVKNL